MSAPNIIKKMDIFYFPTLKKVGQGQLKNFIHFLNFFGIKKPIRFAYIEEEGSLLNNLSLRENIYLDSIPSSVSAAKGFSLEEELSKTGNEALLELFSKITLLDELPQNVDEQSRKLTSLIKGLLKESDFLFLESPEKNLHFENLNLFKKALEFQTSTQGQTILIASPDELTWESFINKKVSRGPSKEFIISSIINNKTRELFIKDQEESSSEGILDFDSSNSTNKRAA